MLDQINAKIVDGANEYSTLTHASYIGPKWWVEMTEAMVQPFTERFTNEYNREPGPSGIAIIESSVGKQTLLPDTVVRERINFVVHKQCNLPHIRNPTSLALRKTVHPYVYANDSFMKAIKKQINSPERSKWYDEAQSTTSISFLASSQHKRTKTFSSSQRACQQNVHTKGSSKQYFLWKFAIATR
jgi:hypothetical protein